MNCPNCQRPLQEGSKFCPHCGAEVNRKSFCPSCKGEVQTGWKACPNCGTALDQSLKNNFQYHEPSIYPKHGHHYGSSSPKRHKRKGFLGNLFSS